MNKNIPIAIVALLIVVGVVWSKEALAPTLQWVTPAMSSTIEYRNTTYGFRVTLPKNWEGYSVSTSDWAGTAAGVEVGGVDYTSGPLISIRNPKWAGAGTYQDIPIMVFTLAQWNELDQEVFHIGAAPMNPSELGRNATYIFALPARYNYAFPTGYEEVDQILQSKPLKTFPATP